MSDERVRIGKRLMRDAKTGIYKYVTIFGEPEPEQEVRQIRAWTPDPIPESVPEPVVATPPPPPVEAPVDEPVPVAPLKPKRKPRPYKPRPKKRTL